MEFSGIARWFVPAGTVLALLSCASAPVPVARMAATQAAIRTAGEVQAGQEPRAALHLRLAQEQYHDAQALLRAGEGERADLMLQRAETDAELAVALTRESTARAQAQRTQAQVRALETGAPAP